ncbi:MAG: site-specific integrase [Alistipes sp.]|jgi:site-specific recombinase XerD|nr:site-specific integrase [Alistipes sp.]
MKISINVICRKDKIYKNNTAPIHVRFTLNRQTRYVSTGVAVLSEDWDFDVQRIKPSLIHLKETQHQIDKVLFEYERKIKRLDALDIEVTFDNLLEANNRKVNCTLSDCFTREIQRLEALGKHNSVSKVKTVFSLVSQFHKPTIRLEEIDLAYLNNFELFLRKRGNMNNSIATKFSVLKAIYNKALNEELFTPKTNPFVRFKVGRLWTATRKRAITKEELQRLTSIEIPSTASPYVAFASDIFLFTYYVAGINIGDIAHLEHKDIRNGRIDYIRRKTGKRISCQLMPIATEIIEKYSSPFYDDADYIFPILDKNVHKTDLQRFNRIHKITAKVNKGLVELAKSAKIETHLTTYVARHTFAIVALTHGMSIDSVAKMLGHSNTDMTRHYARVLDAKIC